MKVNEMKVPVDLSIGVTDSLPDHLDVVPSQNFYESARCNVLKTRNFVQRARYGEDVSAEMHLYFSGNLVNVSYQGKSLACAVDVKEVLASNFYCGVQFHESEEKWIFRNAALAKDGTLTLNMTLQYLPNRAIVNSNNSIAVFSYLEGERFRVEVVPCRRLLEDVVYVNDVSIVFDKNFEQRKVLINTKEYLTLV